MGEWEQISNGKIQAQQRWKSMHAAVGLVYGTLVTMVAIGSCHP